MVDSSSVVFSVIVQQEELLTVTAKGNGRTAERMERESRLAANHNCESLVEDEETIHDLNSIHLVIDTHISLSYILIPHSMYGL